MVCGDLVSIKFEFVINAARALDSTFLPSWLTGLSNEADHFRFDTKRTLRLHADV